MRLLAADEAELWAKVAATIRPLSRQPLKQPPAATAPTPAATISKAPAAASRPAAAPAPRPARHSDATLDGSWDRKLKSGSLVPDRTLDLHGRNLDQAWRAIDESLEQAIANQDRVLLLITGHARPGEPPIQRGKIRAAVHDWLAVSRHAGRIAAVRGAHPRHGGTGSLYIILRNRRPGSTFS